ncbi:MAG: septum site-determining protein MinC [Pseudomonadota bacterium]|nr:septum site-determining protein MinC [Pseudomonadota bacterium]
MLVSIKDQDNFTTGHVMQSILGTEAFKIKGGMTTVLIMHLYSDDIKCFENQLKLKVASAPHMFKGANVVVDFTEMEKQDHYDLHAMSMIITSYSIVLLGIKNCSHKLEQLAKQYSINILSDTKSPPKLNTQAKNKQPMFLNKQIRSGQQVYAKECDLVITGSVSSGAEIIADGSIHILGTLSGKAIAGASGNKSSYVFASTFNAELVAIAGIYKVYEASKNFTNTHIYLKNNQIIITSI